MSTGQTSSSFLRPFTSCPLLLLGVLALLLAGCFRASPAELASSGALRAVSFSGKYFDMVGYERGAGATLYVYIEGDGKAWVTRSRPSVDPTPTNPIGLRLASVDTHEAVFYLPRPCQYVEGEHRRNCAIPFWTSARFSEPVVSEMNAFLDQAKARAKATRLKLLGYSGGGCIALLLAERRNDVDVVVTVAGNVDPAFWTRWHNVSPLRDSLNPLDRAAALQQVQQLHIVSDEDSIMPPEIVRHFVANLPSSKQVEIVQVNDIAHTGDWQDVVPGILLRSGIW